MVYRLVQDAGGSWGQSLWAIFGKKAKALGKYATVFWAKIYAILVCAYEIQTNARLEKYVSISSDSQAALKALKAAKITSPLVQQCHKASYDVSTQQSVGMFWVPGHCGVNGNEIGDGLARKGTVHHFVGPEPALGVSRQNTRKTIKHWIASQHMVT
jgi:ribonuclease HI